MKNVRSISRAIRILEAFGEGSSFSVTEISKKLKLPKSSVYEILSTLTEEGVMEKVSNQYHLGLKLLELGYTVRHNLELSRVSPPLLKRLNESLDETVQLTILNGDEVLYLEGFESSKQLRTFFALGDRAFLHCTAVGKAILAFLPGSEIERIIAGKGLKKYTSNTLVDKERLLEDLRATVARGYSIDNMEHEEGVRCVAAPIRNREGRVIASVSVSGPANRIMPERDAEIAEQVIKTAGEISRRLGYQPGTIETLNGPRPFHILYKEDSR